MDLVLENNMTIPRHPSRYSARGTDDIIWQVSVDGDLLCNGTLQKRTGITNISYVISLTTLRNGGLILIVYHAEDISRKVFCIFDLEAELIVAQSVPIDHVTKITDTSFVYSREYDRGIYLMDCAVLPRSISLNRQVVNHRGDLIVAVAAELNLFVVYNSGFVYFYEMQRRTDMYPCHTVTSDYLLDQIWYMGRGEFIGVQRHENGPRAAFGFPFKFGDVDMGRMMLIPRNRNINILESYPIGNGVDMIGLFESPKEGSSLAVFPLASQPHKHLLCTKEPDIGYFSLEQEVTDTTKYRVVDTIYHNRYKIYFHSMKNMRTVRSSFNGKVGKTTGKFLCMSDGSIVSQGYPAEIVGYNYEYIKKIKKNKKGAYMGVIRCMKTPKAKRSSNIEITCADSSLAFKANWALHDEKENFTTFQVKNIQNRQGVDQSTISLPVMPKNAVALIGFYLNLQV